MKAPRRPKRPATFLFGLLATMLILTGVGYGAEECKPLVNRDRLYDAQFTGDGEIWMVGYPGLILHSTDSGKTFTRPCGLTDQALFAVDFIDPQHGWIVGRNAMLMSTADGGATWATHERPCESPPPTWEEVDFTWLVDRYLDRSAYVIEQPEQPNCNEALFALDFVDAQNGWLVGNHGWIVRTRDGGATWRVSSLPIMNSASLYGVTFLDEQRGFVVGDNPVWESLMDETITAHQISNMYATTDGGLTWRAVPTGVDYTLYDIYFRNAQEGWAVGGEGSIVRTTDGGATWQVVDSTPAFANYHKRSHLFKIADDGESVWITGHEGVLLKLTGENLLRVETNTRVWLACAAFGPTGVGVVAGAWGTLLVSGDKGDTWTPHLEKKTLAATGGHE